MYDPLPPLALITISPSLSPLHDGCVSAVVKLTCVGTVTDVVLVFVQPTPSLTVIT